MGDRATLQIINGDHGVEIYTHWGGQAALIAALDEAITRAPDRITDPTYFTRVVICALVKDDINGTTGVGVWAPNTQENEYPLFVFDVKRQTVKVSNKTFGLSEFQTWAKMGTHE